jgi:DNA-binding transcriptional LysR family regulator
MYLAMKNMPGTHRLVGDLNLLGPLRALLEEQHVTRAAARCGMSQPAMSRALERLREMFADELLVRADGAYERTARAERILVELQDVLPRIETAIRGERFEAALSKEHFRIATTEPVGALLLPSLYESVYAQAPGARIIVTTLGKDPSADLEAGRIDLLVSMENKLERFTIEPLFTDEPVCLMSRTHPLSKKPVTLKRYLGYPHVTLVVRHGGMPWIDHALAERGLERQIAFSTPFLMSAVLAAARGEMICTIPRRFAAIGAKLADVTIVPAPKEIPNAVYNMAWHPRLHSDAAQMWFRDRLREAACESERGKLARRAGR